MDKQTTQLVRRRASHRCEYCHIPEPVSDLMHVIDHVIARQHRGKDSVDNLALCCVRCNQHKGPNLSGIDPDAGAMIRLFNPRTDRWSDHFEYDGAVLVSRTAVARTTIVVLAINHPLRIAVRHGLLKEGVKLG